jgi:hypothetical protein
MLLECKVLPLELGTHNLFIQNLQQLVCDCTQPCNMMMFGVSSLSSSSSSSSQSHYLLEETQDLVVRNSTRIRKVPHALQLSSSHLQRNRQHVVQDRHRVGNINHLGVLGDLSDEAAMAEIVGNWHSQPKRQDIGVFTKELHVIQ